MRTVRMLHENGRLEIFIKGIKSEENVSVGVTGKNLVVWGEKFDAIKLPYKARIAKKRFENNGLTVILKRQ